MASPSFLIKNGGTEFMSRQKNVFDILSVIEQETSLSKPSEAKLIETGDDRKRGDKRKRTKRFRGKESMFKVPTDPPPRFQRPGQNPRKRGKWIKYSLADVSDYDMSNEGNTAAALSFLKGIKERKAIEEAKSKIDLDQKHLFKSPTTDSTIDKLEDTDGIKASKSVFVSSKLIMPEYVVGQSRKCKKPVNKLKVEKTKELYLDHIHMYEDE